MILFIAIAIVNIILTSLMWPGTCRIEPKAIWKFLKIMSIVTAIRVSLIMIVGSSEGDAEEVTMSVPFWSLLLVFWEDAFFTLPAVIVEKLGGSKFDVNLALFISSVAFASGHIAYGLPWAAITLLYVSQLSYKKGKVFGFGTVMICHILYDMITYATLRWLV